MIQSRRKSYRVSLKSDEVLLKLNERTVIRISLVKIN